MRQRVFTGHAIRCPKCGSRGEVERLPSDVLGDVDSGSFIQCPKCSLGLWVYFDARGAVVVLTQYQRAADLEWREQLLRRDIRRF